MARKQRRTLILWVAISCSFVAFGWIYQAAQERRLRSGQPPAKVWERFTPADGRFSIEMPEGPAKDEQDKVDTVGSGRTIHLVMYGSSADFVGYSAGYFDYPQDVRKWFSDEALLAAILGNAATVHGTPVAERLVTMPGATGRELVYRKEGKILRFRILIADDRCYMLLVTTPASSQHLSQHDRFFASFHAVP